MTLPPVRAKQSELSILLTHHMVAVAHLGDGGERRDADEMLSCASRCRQSLPPRSEQIREQNHVSRRPRTQARRETLVRGKNQGCVETFNMEIIHSCFRPKLDILGGARRNQLPRRLNRSISNKIN